VMFRTVGDFREVRDQLAGAIGTSATIDDVLIVPPVRLRTVPDFETAVFAYTTDIPFLEAWGTPMLLGPGSITVAHTDAECVEVAELVRAVDAYERLVR